jgi:hypothetical protein
VGYHAHVMPDHIFFGLIFGSILLGIQGERWRAAWARSEWRARKSKNGYKKQSNVSAFPVRGQTIPDAADQLRIVTAAQFDKRRLLSKKEAQVFHQLETAVAGVGKGWRVMAQVNLGEILSCQQKDAFGAINSKRVDMLVVCNRSFPIAAVEYQGEGHYQGSAAARDAVKKEALRKAGVRYFEVTPDHSPSDIAHEISRIAQVEQLKQSV